MNVCRLKKKGQTHDTLHETDDILVGAALSDREQANAPVLEKWKNYSHVHTQWKTKTDSTRPFRQCNFTRPFLIGNKQTNKRAIYSMNRGRGRLTRNMRKADDQDALIPRLWPSSTFQVMPQIWFFNLLKSAVLVYDLWKIAYFNQDFGRKPCGILLGDKFDIR